MTKLTTIALVAAFALSAPITADAQVETRDHRSKDDDDQGTTTRDHRAKKKKKPRPAKDPAVRDHRKRKPVVRDHGNKGPVVRDHSKDTGEGKGEGDGAGRVGRPQIRVDAKLGNKEPRPLVRDHRMEDIDWDKRRKEYRVQAEARWKKRRAELAKKEAERRAAYEARREERIKSREERRRKRREAIRARWEAKFLAEAEVQRELERHARRLARINRLRNLAEIKSRGKLVIRIEVVAQHENDRHEMRMGHLRAKYAAE